jgi:ribosomal protein S18 acetylase RimI-like enzyme
MKLQTLVPQDYDAYFALRLESLQQCPNMYATDANDWQAAAREVIEKHLVLSESGESPVFGAWQGDNLVGLVGLKPNSRPTVRHKASLWGLYVQPNFRHQGAGKRLVEMVIAEANEMPYLELLRAGATLDGDKLLHFFAACGFREYGREPRSKLFNGVYYDQAYFWRPLADAGNG